ncbi:MAG: hypothetical protein IJ713_01805 [Oscillibacter sp.]|nr:hypothetical protein [Oscillibacter sp.]
MMAVREETPEQRERRRARMREYYQKNRERILARQREYYREKGRAWNAQRARAYRAAHHEAYCDQRRAYRAANRDYFLAQDRKYRETHHQECLERSRRYWQENRERLLEEKRSYNAAHQEQHRSYARNNQLDRYRKTIGEYSYRAIEKVQRACPERAAALLERYPFDGFAAQRLKKQLRYDRISPAQACYDDCYDAGMLAYLYSVHRCAYMGYRNVEGYIAKMIRIYLICAIVSFRDAAALCRENGLREVRIDALPPGRL